MRFPARFALMQIAPSLFLNARQMLMIYQWTAWFRDRPNILFAHRIRAMLRIYAISREVSKEIK
jgi:hypothetical protein